MNNQPTLFNNACRTQHLKHTIISAMIAYLAGGFLAGMVWCQNCGFNIFAGIFIVIVIGLASTFTFGFSPANEGNVGAPLNAWPCIFAYWQAIYARWFYLHFKKSNKNPPEA